MSASDLYYLTVTQLAQLIRERKVSVVEKDSFETAGLRTTCSYKPLTDHIPQQDATVVARLRQAGAIILGKTNLPPMASGPQTNSPILGRANNPWDTRRTPGGSTGGGAAAIAAGLRWKLVAIWVALSASLRIFAVCLDSSLPNVVYQ